MTEDAPSEPADLGQRVFGAHVAQQLGGPARAVMGFQQLLSEQAREIGRDDLLADLANIETAATTLLGIIDELAAGGLTPVSVHGHDGAARLRHDLRTPLNAIIGYSEMIAEELEGQDVGPLAADLSVILTEARALLERIDDVVTVEAEPVAGDDGRDVARGLAFTLGDVAKRQNAEAGLILVIDDVESNRALLARRLRREGHVVLLAESGRDGLRQLGEAEVDLVLLDVLMPDMNGIEVLAELKANPAWEHVPVIMTSGLTEADAVIRCIEAGADDYLAKPIDPVLLRARVNAGLERKRFADREHRYLRRIEAEKARADALLHAVLPHQIIARLNRGEVVIADRLENVSILFADLVGFTPVAARTPASELVHRLDQIFRAFDALAERHGVEKIKTIGDAYMAAAGLPEPCADHADRVVRLGCAMLETIAEADPDEAPFELRVGIHTGPVVAGLLGRQRFVYDVWGETVNIASRLESQGLPGAIRLSAATRDCLTGAWPLRPHGEIVLRGVGRILAFEVKPSGDVRSI